MNAATLPPGPPHRHDIERAFAHLAEGASGGDPDPIRAMRTFVDRYGDVEPRPPLDGVEVLPVSAAGVDAEWIVPANAMSDARIVLLHGGGWVAGGLESHRPMAATLARLSAKPVLLVAYRLAPEHPFPAAFDDSVAALAWAAANGPRGPAGASAVYLMGDSAGGNLAAAVCQHLAGVGGRMPDRLVLMSPALDGSANPERGPLEAVAADHAALSGVMTAYTQGATPLSDPRISPLNAEKFRLSRFPPTLIQVSSAEFLLWDAREMTSRLTASGVRATLSVWPRLPHVWQAFLTLLPEAKQALAEAADFLRQGR